jgi:hypothetical protein
MPAADEGAAAVQTNIEKQIASFPVIHKTLEAMSFILELQKELRYRQ